jgi:hypothetical protein
MTRRHVIVAAVFTALAMLMGLTAAAAPRLATAHYNGDTGTNRLNRLSLTADGWAAYSYFKDQGTVTAHAHGTGTSGNYRELVFPTNVAPLVDSQQCVTFLSHSATSNQEGMAFRIRLNDAGHTTAVTVTKNVWADVTWNWNVHVWDTRLDPAFTGVGHFDFYDVVGHEGNEVNPGAPLPWRACGWLQGSTLRYKLWVPAVTPIEPSWSDTFHVRQLTIPAGYSTAGRTGLYFAHLDANHTMRSSGWRIYR